MPPRLSALDASFLYLEEASTPMHVGAVSIFRRPKAGFDYDRLVELIEQRIALVPRYRQKVRHVPGNLARPVWVDDPDFDVAYHVRRSALPKPGSDEQLTELVARLMSRPLDHARPLWEMYLVEGLARGRTAVLTKTHQAMVDGISAIDIGQVILDVSPEPRVAAEELWMPRNEPTDVELDLRRGGGGDRPARRASSTTCAPPRGTPSPRSASSRRRHATAVHGPHGQPRHRPGQPAERADLHATPLRDRPHPAGGLPQDPLGARLHGERRRAVGGGGRAAQLAAVPRRARHVVVDDPGDGADVRARPGRRAELDHHRLAGQPGVVVPRGPAGGRAEPGGAAAPGGARDAGEHGGHAGASAPTRSSGSAASRRPPCTRSAPARPAASRNGSSTWW